MIENYTRLSSRMFTATVVGKDKNGRKITEGRETYKTPSGVYEIKDWATKYRGPIAIHAAVKPIRQVVPLLSEKAFGLMVEKLEKASMANGELLTYFNYGEVIATAELVECHLITEEYLSTLSDTEKALGDYSLGRYAWELRNIKELPEPIKAKGQQGLWNWEA